MRNCSDIKKEAKNISVLLSGKTYKYEDLTDKQVLPSDQSRMID